MRPEERLNEPHHGKAACDCGPAGAAPAHPYESSGCPRLGGRFDIGAVESGWWSWPSYLRRVLGATMCCMVPMAAVICADALMPGGGERALAVAAAIAVRAVPLLLGASAVGSIAGAVALACRSCMAGDGDAPSMQAEAAQRADLRLGVATALLPGATRRSRCNAAAWRIDGSGPLHCSPATIVGAVRLAARVQSFFLEASGNPATTVFTVNYYEIRLTDAAGEDRHLWSDALWQNFTVGDSVTAYWYERSGLHGVPRIVVHDVADARYAADVSAHAVQVYHPRWFSDERPRTTAGGEWKSVHPAQWPVAYSSITELRYARPGEAWGGVVTEKKGGCKVLFPCADRVVGHPQHGIDAVENPVERRFEPVEGIVENVLVVPLFNRRFWCGYGYMALVRFAGRSEQSCVWAFCDPRRADSYLGYDEARLRRVPMHMGEAVTVWRSSDGVCVAVPHS